MKLRRAMITTAAADADKGKLIEQGVGAPAGPSQHDRPPGAWPSRATGQTTEVGSLATMGQ